VPSFISENPLVAKVQYWLKITFVFILILFIDSVNRVYRVQLELAAHSETAGPNAYVIPPFCFFQTPSSNLTFSTHPSSAIHGHERLEVQARKFYSQRNMYLCGFTLFLSLILNRTYIMILEVLRLEEKLKQYEGGSGKKGITDGGDLEKEVARLRAELERRDQDLDTLKKQAQGLSREYDSLADKYNSATASGGDSKKEK
jgi:B-cell receptor-associated protein 31